MSDFLERISKLSPKRLALLALELNEKLEHADRRNHEPIAIVGIGCRLPGGADGPDGFWRLLDDGRDAIREVPRARWDIDAYFDADANAPGKMNARAGGYLDDIASFDADYFGISPREALTMDPQQRILIEVTIEALEHAGIAADSLSGSATGVYVGVCNSDYIQRVLHRGEQNIDAYLASGSAHSVAAGRISYYLGLQGPALAIDTACSSSLIALHQACMGLRSGTMGMAIAAGVNVLCTPETTIALSKAHMLAPDGRCKTFDASADGFARAEGCGVLVLKRLADAEADGDCIHAIIRGTASNQDGRSGGLTVPNGPAQEAVINAALADAGLAPNDIDYVEAHGTGTPLGDPIEVRALALALCSDRPVERPLLIGSVKTNFGHLESAAGIAGVIKVVLALQHERIPKHLHFRTPNPHISWSEYRLSVTAADTPWPKSEDRIRRAGVSSFGFSGTNAHVVIEEASSQPAAEPAARRAIHCVPVSAHSETALRELAEHYATAIEKLPADADMADIAYTSGLGRSHRIERLAVVAQDRTTLCRALTAFARGEQDDALARGASNPAQAPEVVFMFTGQGSQYPGMARALYDTSPVFRDVIDRCDRILGGDNAGRHLKSVLWPSTADDAAVHETVWTQPALFAVEYGLSEVWRSCGIEPAAAIGHSVGEYVAACVAGVFSLDDGLQLVAERGRLMQALPRVGAMAAIFASEADVAAAIAGMSDRLAIAAVNGPENVVVSGASDAVDAILQQFQRHGIRGQKLFVSLAAHSPLVTPALEAMTIAAGRVSMKPPRIPVAWNLTGGCALPGNGAPDPTYWRRHLREPVRFADGIAQLNREGFRTFLEIGPHPTLTALVRQALPDDGTRLLHSLRREHDDWSQMLSSLAQLYVSGASVNWRGVAGPYGRNELQLPGYPFQRRPYWVSPDRAERRPRARPSSTPLQGTRLDVATPVFQTELSTTTLTYLDQHRVQGAALSAGPVLMEMAQAAAMAEFGTDRRAICPFTIEAPLLLDRQDRIVQVAIEKDADGIIAFSIHSRNDAEAVWTRHATGSLQSIEDQPISPLESLGELQRRLGPVSPSTEHYKLLASRGIDLGPAFQSLVAFQRDGNDVLADLALPDACTADRVHWAHPVLVDGALQACGLAVAGISGAFEDDIYLFTGVERIVLYAPLPRTIHCHARLEGQDDLRPKEWRASVVLFGEDGSKLGEIDGVRLQRSSRRGLERLATAAGTTDPDRLFYRLDWQDAPIAPPSAASLPRPSAIADAIQRVFSAKAIAHGLAIYDELLPVLDRASAVQVVRALAALGFDWRVGREFDEPTERRRLGIVDRFARLFTRLLAILVEDGFISHRGGRLSIARSPLPIDDTSIEFANLLARFSDTDAELRILRRCSEVLSEVLTGRADPLQLLFPGGSLTEARKLYVESPFAATYNGALAEALRLASSSMPEGCTLRILEVGAGTGGTTSHVLPHLQADTTEYTFTDISPLFVSRAAEQFAEFHFVRYATLDIERDPAQQGFQSRSFDIVIASNVLHATADLAQALDHVRQLLAPDGMLLLLEGTRPERWVDLTFGLTEGWWRFSDTSLRPDYPLIDSQAWSSLLARGGFEDTTELPNDRKSSRGSAQQSLIIARLPRKPRRFTVVGGGGLGRELASRLRGRGHDVVTLDADAIDRAAEPHGDIVYLGAMSLTALGLDDKSGSEACRSLSCALPLRWMQLTVSSTGPNKIYLATSGVYARSPQSASVAPWQAPLWGLGRVFALEHPSRWGGLVDLPTDARDADLADLLMRSLNADDTEDQTCWRDGRRLSARLLATDAPPRAEGFELRSDATYIVTGGFGGLGLLVGKWLADNGARNIALLGRRPDPAHESVRAIEVTGARVFSVACDVADEAQLSAALDRLSSVAPQIAGIVHAAADFDSSPIATMTGDQMERVLRPKIDGTIALERIALRHPIDFLVLFSSTTALIGASGLGHYAAANAFLDAVADHRVGSRTKVISVNWGTWQVMRLASAEAQRGYREGGLEPMRASVCLAALRDLINADCSRGIVASVDWSVLKSLHEARRVRPLLSSLDSQKASHDASVGPAGPADSTLGEILALVPEASHGDRIVEFVAAQVAGVLGREDPMNIPLEIGLFEMGMDSLMSVELTRRLERGIGFSLPTTLTFNYPSIAALAAFLHGKLRSSNIQPRASSPRVPAPLGAETTTTPASSLDHLSEDEIEARLLARLERIK